MPNTTNFNWPTPADTDLVKDGAAAIRNLGNGIDTSLIDLKGGTTGQILSKASNADMDFTFITPNVGDITEVQAGTGISVASGTGPIPVVTNSMATEITAKGDLIVGTGNGTFDNLPVGTNGYTLVADSSTATGLAYAAPSAGLTWAAGGNGNLPAASSLQLSISAKESVIIRISGMSTTADAAFYLRINNSSASVYDYNGFSHTTNTTATTNYIKQINDSKFELNFPNGLNAANNEGTWYIRVDGCKNGGFVSMYTTGLCKNVGDNNLAISFGGMFQTSGAVTTLDLILSAGNFDAGTYEYWVA